LQTQRECRFRVLILLFFLGVFSILVAIGVVNYIHQNNCIVNYEGWDTIDKHNGIKSSFLTGPQALAGNMLNLGTWGSINEVLYRTPIILEELSCRFLLDPNAYLCIILDYRDDLYKAVRLSSSDKYPNALVVYDSQGCMHSSTPIQAPPLTPNDWHSLKLSFDKAGARVNLDEQVFPLPIQLGQTPGKFGFRNGTCAAAVDDVRIVDATTKAAISESFDGRHLFKKALLFVLACAAISLMVLLVAGWLLMRNWHTITEYALVIMLTLIGAGIVYGLFHFFVLAKLYPIEQPIIGNVNVFPDLIQALTEKVIAQYNAIPPDNGKRVLFLGTSQTAGLGANVPSECYVATLERLLNDGNKGAPPIHCINAGRTIFSIRHCALVHKGLADCPVDVTVVDMACNDSLGRTSEESYAEHLETVAHEILDRGSKVIFVVEPSNPEAWPDGWRLDPTLRRVGAKLGIPVIDANAYLRERHDTGVLFWDYVHPTSYGHRLIAECLVSPILQALGM
jgi:lysophospholipase L1-like esterase